MHCFVYRSRKRDDTYLYLRERDAFALLPENIAATLGALDFVLEVELTPGRRLAREDAGVVRANLAARGFHLQFPPRVDGEVSN
ncbi:MAG: YcgL domain-containing protein [Xanthomonadales bacterium]|nr:YcgL domain-containing protein [Xanthomonadales bacterium]MBK7144488.1 YcgL domain-containing protein [Xanthomonadales bacterium]MCC6561325.1 YcgL domain-containing protein [Xanthomonadales bacterium]